MARRSGEKSKQQPGDELIPLAEVAPEGREAAYSQVLEASRDDSRELRAASAETLGALATPAEAVESLGRLAEDTDVGVRYAAVAALAGLPWRMRFGYLRQAQQDADLGVVAVAADGLSHAGDKRAASTLHQLLQESRTRFGAMEGLYALRDPELVPFSRKLFSQFFSPMFDKALAALALAREGDGGALEFLLQRVQRKYAEERNFVLAHIASTNEKGRAAIEQIAKDQSDASCETALLALTRIDADWWPQAQAAIGRNLEADPFAAGEVLLGLFDIDWRRVMPIADAHLDSPGHAGVAARRVRLLAWLRTQYESEVQLRCD